MTEMKLRRPVVMVCGDRRIEQVVLLKYLPMLIPGEFFLLTPPGGANRVVPREEHPAAQCMRFIEDIYTYFEVGADGLILVGHCDICGWAVRMKLISRGIKPELELAFQLEELKKGAEFSARFLPAETPIQTFCIPPGSLTGH